MPEDISREELKQLKRQAAIRAKEEEYEQKRRQEEERKKNLLEQLSQEREAEEKRKVEERLAGFERQAAVRAQRKARTEKLNARREERIRLKQEAWLQKSNTEIQAIIAEQDAEEERVEHALEEARERKREREQGQRDKVNLEKARREELEQRREEAENNRKAQREVRAIYRVDQLKTEATEELESFILNPYPVPLKQVLAGRMRPVPTVTELLAAYKDQKEDLKELEDQDIPTRALLRNQSLFQYVRDIQLKAESERIKPPEPQMADLGRSRNRSSSPRSPPKSTKFRGTGSMRTTR